METLRLRRSGFCALVALCGCSGDQSHNSARAGGDAQLAAPVTLCPSCSPAPSQDELAPASGEPPLCSSRETAIDAAKAEGLGFHIAEFVERVEGQVSAPVRWRGPERKATLNAELSSTQRFVLLERHANTDGALCEDVLRIEFAVQLSSDDGSLAGTLEGWTALHEGPLGEVTSVRVWDDAAELRSDLQLDYGSRGRPDALAAQFELVRFRGDAQAARFGLELVAIDRDQGGVEYVVSTLASTTMQDGCDAVSVPVGQGRCMPVDIAR